MAIKLANAEWTGDFKTGCGVITSGNCNLNYSYGSIYGEEPGTSPTQMLGATIAGCYTGGLSAVLARNGYSPKHIDTDAQVHLEPNGPGFKVVRIHLATKAEVDEIDSEKFQTIAQSVLEICPVCQALAAIEITLEAELRK